MILAIVLCRFRCFVPIKSVRRSLLSLLRVYYIESEQLAAAGCTALSDLCTITAMGCTAAYHIVYDLAYCTVVLQ